MWGVLQKDYITLKIIEYQKIIIKMWPIKSLE